MKIRWFECPTAKRARLEQWHPWFAWRPVRIGPTQAMWLERVMRRGYADLDTDMVVYYKWEYKELVDE